jgi:hypothetical protein
MCTFKRLRERYGKLFLNICSAYLFVSYNNRSHLGQSVQQREKRVNAIDN